MNSNERKEVLRKYIMMWKFWLLVLFCSVASTESVAKYAVIDRCDSNDPGYLRINFAVNEPLALCCWLSRDKCEQTSMNDTLTLVPMNGSSDTRNYKLSRLGRCEIKLEKESASFQDEGRYNCMRNDEFQLRSEIVRVINKPAKANITGVVCTPKKKITLTFQRGIPTDGWDDMYEISMIEYGATTVLCNTSSSKNTCKDMERVCMCEYSGNNIPADTDVEFIVNVSRPLQYVETRKIYNLMEYIRPGVVEKLETVSTTFSDATVMLTLKGSGIQGNYGLSLFMCSHGRPLLYKMKVEKTQGSPEELKLTLDPTPGCNRTKPRFIQIYLTNLVAFTTYSVTAWASGGGGDGNTTLLNFTTSMTVPSSPPHVDDFGFTYINQSVLLLMWQPLPHEAQGGPNLTYSIEVTAPSGFQKKITAISQTYKWIMHRKFPAEPLTARIWAHNAVGQSENYSEVIIQQRSASLTPKMHVELDENRVHVFVDKTNTSEVFKLHICKGHLHSELELPTCQEYPKTRTVQVKSTMEYQMSLDEQNKPEKTEENRTVNICYQQRLSDRCLGNTGMAVASVIKLPSEDSTVMDRDALGDNEEPAIRDLSFLVFLSEKTGGVSSGLIHTNCYFDRVQDEVDKALLKIDDGNINKSHLNIILEQKCDPKKPRQFLIDTYEIAASQDNNCDNNTNLIGSKKNQIFQPMPMSVPRNVPFLCVTAKKFSGKKFTFPEPVMVISVSPEQDPPVDVAFVVPVSVAGVFLILILVLTYRYCRRRRAHAQSLRQLQLPVQQNGFYGRNSYGVENRSPPEVPERRALITSLNTDSSSVDVGLGSSYHTSSPPQHLDILIQHSVDDRQYLHPSHACNGPVRQNENAVLERRDSPGVPLHTSEYIRITTVHDSNLHPEGSESVFSEGNRSSGNENINETLNGYETGPTVAETHEQFGLNSEYHCNNSGYRRDVSGVMFNEADDPGDNCSSDYLTDQNTLLVRQGFTFNYDGSSSASDMGVEESYLPDDDDDDDDDDYDDDDDNSGDVNDDDDGRNESSGKLEACGKYVKNLPG